MYYVYVMFRPSLLTRFTNPVIAESEILQSGSFLYMIASANHGQIIGVAHGHRSSVLHLERLHATEARLSVVKRRNGGIDRRAEASQDTPVHEKGPKKGCLGDPSLFDLETSHRDTGRETSQATENER